MSQIAFNRELEQGKKRIANRYKQLMHRGMKTNLRMQDIGVEGDLDASLKAGLGYEYGALNRIGFKFLRRGVFVELGVGRGYPISRVQNNRNAQTGRVAKPWYNEELDKYQPQLADDMMELHGDVVVKSIRIGSKKSVRNGG